MRKKFLSRFFWVLLFSTSLFSQEHGFQIPDSLKTKPYQYFFDQMEAHELDTIQAIFYIDAWLQKAKNENNNKEIVRAFSEKIYFVKDDLPLKFADSAILFALKTKDNEVIGKSFFTRGTKFYLYGNYEKALSLFLKADDYFSKTESEYLRYKLKFSIANIKYYLEFYEEALALFEGCASYFKTSEDYNYRQGYLNSLNSMGLCYAKLKKYDLCTTTNEFALSEARRIGDESMIGFLIQSEGINQYFKKNYLVSIKKLEEARPLILKEMNFGTATVGQFYTAKSYWDLGQKEKAIFYFKKVDAYFEKEQYMRPDFREGYELLVTYYKEKDDFVNQLFYINRLLKADSVLNENYKNMSSKIHKEYDTKALLLEKEQAENKLAESEILIWVLYVGIGFLFVFSLMIYYRYYNNKKIFKAKLESFLNNENQVVQDDEPKATPPKKPLEINPEVVQNILKALEKFEVKNKFLKKDITLVSLAKDFETNSNYLSKVIQYEKDKNFTNYLNDLRIGYITKLMQKDTRYRNYTIKALAEEAGFATPQHFSKAFFAVHGFYPSLFLSEMNQKSA
uniref:helix-turn-helix domain-containing protein n=3 Tax=Flavobacterium sp. TaxID=239 RepID=UPI004049ADC7